MRPVFKIITISMLALIIVSMLIYANTRRKMMAMNVDDMYRDAVTAVRKHQPDEAIGISTAALSRSPDYADLHIIKGRAYLMKGDHESALRSFSSALRVDPGNREAMEALITTNMSIGQLRAALDQVNRYLKRYPSDRRMMERKFRLLNTLGQGYEAEEMLRMIGEKWPRDSAFAEMNYYYNQERGETFRKAMSYGEALESYKRAVAVKPRDTASLRRIVEIAIMQGQFSEANVYNRQLLRIDSHGLKYLLFASDIALALKDRKGALAYAQHARERYPGDPKARQHFADICLALSASGSPEEKTQYAGLALAAGSSDKSAVLSLIDGYIASGNYETALSRTNAALHQFPNDRDLAARKLTILRKKGSPDESSNYLAVLMKNSPDQDLSREYAEVQLARAKAALKRNDTFMAFRHAQQGLSSGEDVEDLKMFLVGLFTMRGQYDSAIAHLDGLYREDQGNEQYLFRKAGLLEAQKKHAEAAALTERVYGMDPVNPRYKQALADQLLGIATQSAREGDYGKVVSNASKVLSLDPRQHDAWIYLSNAYFAGARPDSALLTVKEALRYFPGDSLLTVKSSTLLQANGQHLAAVQTIRGLRNRFPSDPLLTEVYMDEMKLTGKYYQRKDQWDSSLAVFRTLYLEQPRDSFTLENLAAIHFVNESYDSVVRYASIGLSVYPDNEYLLLKKALAEQHLKRYADAYVTAKHLYRISPGNSAYRDYVDEIRTKSFRNRIGIARLQSWYPQSKQTASFTGLSYMRQFNRGSVTTTLNYAERTAANGFQAEIDAYVYHGTKYYSNITAAAANTAAFPDLRLNYSLFRQFKRAWEGEIGARYLKLHADSALVLSGVLSGAKSIGNVFVNLRGYLTTMDGRLYHSYTLTGRYYLNDHADYLNAVVGIGTAPDDRSIEFNYNRFADFVSKSFALGYKKSFRGGFIFNTSLAWYNRRLTESKSQDQFDFFISLAKGF